MKRKKRPPLDFLPAYRNPVARAVAVARMADAARTEQIATLMLEQDEDAAEALAHLAWIIGVGCETSLNVLGLEHITTRRLHGALRGIEAMCLQHGYRWQIDQAVPLQDALAIANTVVIEHAAHAAKFTPGADFLAYRITKRKLQRGDIAGAELYRGEAA